MTQDDKDNIILKMQYRNALFANKLNDALSKGNCSDKLVRKNVDFNYMLDILRRYDVTEGAINCLTEDQFCQIRNKLLTLLN